MELSAGTGAAETGAGEGAAPRIGARPVIAGAPAVVAAAVAAGAAVVTAAADEVGAVAAEIPSACRAVAADETTEAARGIRETRPGSCAPSNAGKASEAPHSDDWTAAPEGAPVAAPAANCVAAPGLAAAEAVGPATATKGRPSWPADRPSAGPAVVAEPPSTRVCRVTWPGVCIVPIVAAAAAA